MTDPRPRTFALVVGLLVAGGAAVFFAPQSASSVAQWVIGGLVAVATLHVVAHNAPVVWWTSPFDSGDGRTAAEPDLDEIARIRARLSGRRVPIERGGAAVPPETLRILRPLIEELVSRRAAPGHTATSGDARLRIPLSPLTRAVLHADPTIRPGWWGTLRPDEAAVAEIVHHVLDDLARIEARAQTSNTSAQPADPAQLP